MGAFQINEDSTFDSLVDKMVDNLGDKLSKKSDIINQTYSIKILYHTETPPFSRFEQMKRTRT